MATPIPEETPGLPSPLPTTEEKRSSYQKRPKQKVKEPESKDSVPTNPKESSSKSDDDTQEYGAREAHEQEYFTPSNVEEAGVFPLYSAILASRKGECACRGAKCYGFSVYEPHNVCYLDLLGLIGRRQQAQVSHGWSN